MNHYVVYLKLIQYYKLTILQLKKNKKKKKKKECIWTVPDIPGYSLSPYLALFCPGPFLLHRSNIVMKFMGVYLELFLVFTFVKLHSFDFHCIFSKISYCNVVICNLLFLFILIFCSPCLLKHDLRHLSC